MTSETMSSSPKTPLDKLKDALQRRINTLNSSKVKYRSYYNGFTLGLTVLAAGNTALVAASQLDKDSAYWSYLAILASALIAVISGADGLVKPREKHGQNADALNEVYDIQARVLWRELQQPPISNAEVDAFFLEFRRLEKSFFASLVKINLQEK